MVVSKLAWLLFLLGALLTLATSQYCFDHRSCVDCTAVTGCQWCEEPRNQRCEYIGAYCALSRFSKFGASCPCDLRLNCSSCVERDICNWCLEQPSPGPDPAYCISGQCSFSRRLPDRTCPAPPPPPCADCETPDWALAIAVVNIIFLVLGIGGLATLLATRSKNARMASPDNKELPREVSELLNASNTTKAPIEWAGRPQLGCSPVVWFALMVLAPVVPIIICFADPKLYFLALIILPWLACLVASLFFFSCFLPMDSSTVYVLTKDAAYVFGPKGCACCNPAVSLLIKKELHTFKDDPRVSYLQSDGSGNIELGYIGVVFQADGFVSIKNADKVCKKMCELRKEYLEAHPDAKKAAETQSTTNAINNMWHLSAQQPNQVMAMQLQDAKFDPYTGKPLQAQQPVPQGARFDPYTGKRVDKKEPEQVEVVQIHNHAEGSSGTVTIPAQRHTTSTLPPAYDDDAVNLSPPAYDSAVNSSGVGSPPLLDPAIKIPSDSSKS